MAKKTNSTNKFKTQKNKLIKSRELYRIIAMSQDIPQEEVKDVISALVEVIFMASTRGYEISIPNLGFFTYVDKVGKKKGELQYVTDVFAERTKDDEQKRIIEVDGKKYIEYIEDQDNYRLPHFTFYRSMKDKVKEESKKWQE